MKKYAIVLIWLVLAAFLAAGAQVSAHEGHDKGGQKPMFTKHFQNSLFDVTQHARYSVEILPDDHEYDIGKNVIGIVVHDDRDDDVAGATLRLELKNSDGVSPLKTSVTDKGSGLYVISGLDLKKEGRWALTVTVKKGRTEDSVDFSFPDAFTDHVPKGRYSP